MRTILFTTALLVALSLSSLPALADEPLSGELASTTRWSGEVRIRDALTVPAGVTLTVEPGTTVRVAPGGTLIVRGKLYAATDDPQRPIRFLPEDDAAPPASWEGIHFVETDAKSELDGATVTGAKSVQVNRSTVRVANCTLSGGETGVTLAWPGNSLVEDNIIRDMGKGGVELSMGATAMVRRNTITGCREFGISAGQRVSAYLLDNVIGDAMTGIAILGDIPPVEGNIIRDCEVGIGITQATPRLQLRHNKVSKTRVAIALRNFAAATIEDNVLTGNDDGIRCYRSSSPTIRHNRLEDNRRAVACLQLCNPVIERNVFRGNDVAVFLQLSSYATLRANNFDANRLHLELEDMSSDWERRAMQKPMRGKQAQNQELVSKGKATPQRIEDQTPAEGAVEVPGNWWGEATTAQMNKPAPDADIKAFYDYYDLPKKTYEGYEGEFLQDKILYDGWLEKPVADAGPRPRKAKENSGQE